MQLEACPACRHFDVKTLDRFLAMPSGWGVERGPRSLARPFGISRDAIRRHDRECLTDDRRQEILADLLRGVGVDVGAEEGEGGGGDR